MIWLNKTFHMLWQMLVIGVYFCEAFLIRKFSRDPVRRRQREVRNTSRTCRRLVSAFKVKIRMKNPERLQELGEQNYMLVGNHSAYLDIFILAALENYVFITSVDMSETPVLGDIIRAAGCLYTDRKKKVSLPAEIKRFAETLRAGFKVVLFPEAQGTDGSGVKEFRKSLFQAAVDACSTVLPVCIRYLRLDGKPVTPDNRSVICWYRGINFLKHYWNLLARRVEAEICFLDPVHYDPSRPRSELSDLVYAKVSSAFQSYDAQASQTP